MSKIPQIYAGTKFLETLIETMQESRRAMLEYRHTDWIDLLTQFYAWCSGFVVDEELRKELEDLSWRAFNMQKLIRSNKRFPASDGLNALRQDIFRVEQKLYVLSKDILIRMSDDDEDEINWDEVMSS